MPGFKSLILLLLGLITSGAAVAGDIYRWVDEYGQTHYGDTPANLSSEARELPKKVQPRAGNVIVNPFFNLEKVRVPFSDHGSNMIVEGEVNGVAASFIIDTGATLVVIPPVVAQQAGIKTDKAPRMTIHTAGGDISAPMVTLNSINIGHAAQPDVPAAVHELVGMSPGLGLLGMSFLDHYSMTVDRQSGSLLLEQR
ncbi:MAG: TIGR02281 family clan AA aspartic protease [Mariprofundaceae bacterium]